MIIKNYFHKKGFALGLVLKQRLAASRKWPIRTVPKCNHNFNPACTVSKTIIFFRGGMNLFSRQTNLFLFRCLLKLLFFQRHISVDNFFCVCMQTIYFGLFWFCKEVFWDF